MKRSTMWKKDPWVSGTSRRLAFEPKHQGKFRNLSTQKRMVEDQILIHDKNMGKLVVL